MVKEKVFYAEAAYRRIEKREEMAGNLIKFRVVIRPGKCRSLPDTHKMVEEASTHNRANVWHLIRVIRHHFSFQKTSLRELVNSQIKINVVVALTNLFMANRQLVLIS